MQGQFADRIPVENFHQPGEFLRRMESQPGFDGDGERRFPENGIEEPVQSVGIQKHPGAFALGGNGAGRAAQIQIDLLVATLSALACGPDEVICHLGQDLGDCFIGNGIGNGKIPLLPVGQRPVDGGGDEGQVIAVHAGEVGVMLFPVDAVGKALHGGEIIAHNVPFYVEPPAGCGRS